MTPLSAFRAQSSRGLCRRRRPRRSPPASRSRANVHPMCGRATSRRARDPRGRLEPLHPTRHRRAVDVARRRELRGERAHGPRERGNFQGEPLVVPTGEDHAVASVGLVDPARREEDRGPLGLLRGEPRPGAPLARPVDHVDQLVEDDHAGSPGGGENRATTPGSRGRCRDPVRRERRLASASVSPRAFGGGHRAPCPVP